MVVWKQSQACLLSYASLVEGETGIEKIVVRKIFGLGWGFGSQGLTGGSGCWYLDLRGGTHMGTWYS